VKTGKAEVLSTFRYIEEELNRRGIEPI